jgi:hypothetical protein
MGISILGEPTASIIREEPKDTDNRFLLNVVPVCLTHDATSQKVISLYKIVFFDIFIEGKESCGIMFMCPFK